MNGPTGTKSSERYTRAWPNRLSVLTRLAQNLTTVELLDLQENLKLELIRRRRVAASASTAD
jgi:hypothetical protein